MNRMSKLAVATAIALASGAPFAARAVDPVTGKTLMGTNGNGWAWSAAPRRRSRRGG